MNKKNLSWTAIIFWCGMIFYQSSKPAPASDAESLFIVTLVNSLLHAVAGPSSFEITNGMVRKTAHFFEYFILGSLLFSGYYRKAALKQTFLFALVTGIAYATSDEIHQIFVPGRTCRLFDVMIDSSGIVLGLVLLYWASIRKLRPRERNQSNSPRQAEIPLTRD
jgi:VanZ family protein